MFSQEILKYIQNILEYNCPDSECTYKEPHSNMNQLKQHIQQSHKKQLCSVCVKNKKAFTHEMKMFSVPLLAKHMKEGDKDDLSFKGHPECGFCRVSYYGTDELYAHCREKHEQCFLCQGDKKLNLYFQNYAKLVNINRCPFNTHSIFVNLCKNSIFRRCITRAIISFVLIKCVWIKSL